MELLEIPDRDGWVEVRDAQLDQPFNMRLAVRRGRFVVIGLEVDNGVEVTTKTLRAIRLGAALDEWSGWMRRDELEALGWESRLEAHLDRRREQGIELSADQMAVLRDAGEEISRERARWQDLLSRLPEVESTSPSVRGPGAAPPTAEELQSFARAYIEALLERPRGAVTRVAKQYGMHRVTAHRWITQCRDAGYLPAEEA